MHFLLTNDDGINAPGLLALEQAIRLLPDTSLSIVAPATEQSQCGHRVTTRQELAVRKHAERRYSVKGTPADCIRIALFTLGIKPDFVISGVNAGGNMGQDLYISGTVAGAREAAFHGIPAAAFSHYMIKELVVDWPRIGLWTRDVIGELLNHTLDDGEFWNVNYPHLEPGLTVLPERVRCHPCRSPLNVSYEMSKSRGSTSQYLYTASYGSRPAEPESDVAVCFGGRIAVSRLRV
jgi:5'-nucleotidase